MSWEVSAVIITALISIMVAAVRFMPVHQQHSNPGSSSRLAVLESELKHLRKSHDELRATVQTLIDKVMEWMKSH